MKSGHVGVALHIPNPVLVDRRRRYDLGFGSGDRGFDLQPLGLQYLF